MVLGYRVVCPLDQRYFVLERMGCRSVCQYQFADPHSFPAGHAARAFLIATIATGLGPSGLAMVLWIWAPLVALARVAMGVHYLSDIVAGALFGILAAWIGLQIY